MLAISTSSLPPRPTHRAIEDDNYAYTHMMGFSIYTSFSFCLCVCLFGQTDVQSTMGVTFFVAINQGILGTIGVLQVRHGARMFANLLSRWLLGSLVWHLHRIVFVGSSFCLIFALFRLVLLCTFCSGVPKRNAGVPQGVRCRCVPRGILLLRADVGKR